MRLPVFFRAFAQLAGGELGHPLFGNVAKASA